MFGISVYVFTLYIISYSGCYPLSILHLFLSILFLYHPFPSFLSHFLLSFFFFLPKSSFVATLSKSTIQDFLCAREYIEAPKLYITSGSS